MSNKTLKMLKIELFMWFKIFMLCWVSMFIPWGVFGLAAGLIPCLISSTLIYFLIVRKRFIYFNISAGKGRSNG
jgi:hypothetical protein